MASKLRQLEQQTPSSEIQTMAETTSTPLFERLLHLGSNSSGGGGESRVNPITGFLRRNSLGIFIPTSFSSSTSTHPQYSQATDKTNPNIASKSTTVQQQQQQPTRSQPFLRRQLSHDPNVFSDSDAAQQQQYNFMISQPTSSGNRGLPQMPRRRHMLPRQPSLPLSDQLAASAAASVSEAFPLQQHLQQKVPLETTKSEQSAQQAMQQKQTTVTGPERRKLPTQRQKSRELPSLDDVVHFHQQQQSSLQNQPQQQQQKQQSSSKLQLQVRLECTKNTILIFLVFTVIIICNNIAKKIVTTITTSNNVHVISIININIDKYYINSAFKRFPSCYFCCYITAIIFIINIIDRYRSQRNNT